MSRTLRKALQKIGRMYKAKLVQKIKEDGTTASGNLEKNIRFRTTENSLSIIAPDYLGTVSDGKKATGKNPSGQMVSRIISWMKYKKLPIRNNKGRFITKTSSNYRRASFAIARSINRNTSRNKFQWRGSNVIDRAYKDIEENVNEEIVNAFKASIEETMTNINNK